MIKLLLVLYVKKRKTSVNYAKETISNKTQYNHIQNVSKPVLEIDIRK